MPESPQPKILVIDGPARCGAHLGDVLAGDDCEVVRAVDFDRGLEDLRTRQFSVVLIDLDVPGLDGLGLLHAIRAEKLPTAAIVLTANGERDLALATMKAGAEDFVTKPIDPDRLRCLVRRAVEHGRLRFEVEHLRAEMRREYRFHDLISRSPKLRQVFHLVKQVGPLGSTVLIQGETGTGKELVARAIHASDTRRRGPLVAVNCAVLRESLLENELFGHEAGAYTGADRRSKGRFEGADKGTLFLDELAEIPPSVQAKLLRVLQSGQFERVGGTESIVVDVRLIAATNRRLEDEVKAGRFRADLYYRLKVIQIDLPPLRDRSEDIPLLATHFLSVADPGRLPQVTEIDAEAMQALIDHPWPGNVRELENAIRAGVALCEGTILRYRDLPDTIAPRLVPPAPAEPLIDIEQSLRNLTGDLVGRVERDYLARVLAKYRGNVAQAARHSGLSRRSVTQKILKYELDRKRFRSG